MMHAARTVMVRGRRSAGLLVAGLVMAWSGRAAAQTIAPEPPGPYAVDVRGAIVGIPQSASSYPEVPGGTAVPARGFGGELGAHVYPRRFGAGRLGFGVSFAEVRGTATTAVPPPVAASSSSSSSTSSTATTTPVVFPAIRAWERFIAPQVSINFGGHDGWSYLSAGYGTVREKTEAVAPATSTATVSRSVGAANLGGGARWFLSRHVGVGFDVRFYRMPAATVVGLNAGVSVR